MNGGLTDMARKDDTTIAELDPPQVTATPRLVVPLGRGSRGKTSFIRWAAERAILAGRVPVIADADRTNATLAAFFDGVTRPPSPDPDEVKEWLNDLFVSQVKGKHSAFLDLGGGDQILKEYARSLDLVSFCERFGIEPIAVHFLSPDIDDLAYLRDVEHGGLFAPKRTLLVLNEGVIPSGRSTRTAFEPIKTHQIFRDAVARDARIVVMPRLGCMHEVDRRRLMFSAAAAGRVKPDQDEFDVIRQQMVTTWLREMDAKFAEVAEWLP